MNFKYKILLVLTFVFLFNAGYALSHYRNAKVISRIEANYIEKINSLNKIVGSEATMIIEQDKLIDIQALIIEKLSEERAKAHNKLFL